MKKIILYSFLFVSLWFMTVGMNCEMRQVEIPVLGTENKIIQVDEDGSSYNEQFEINLSSEINRIARENSFQAVGAVLLQGITYTIQDNQSPAGTIINGTIDVSSESFYSEMTPLIEMTNVNLAEKVGILNVPPLKPEGVMVINTELSPYQHLIFGSDFTLYFSLHGTATPPPSAAHPLKFKILVKVYINMIGIIETEVPVM
ncbi:MAG TPA: hypothetical protein PLP19_04650 [bacterium]|nr:hypothetical protein [bacterium]HPN42760.1 hypothetical protein [bacterium]